MGISIDYLEAFIAAVDAGSFSAAAKRLGKAQSRISTAIGNLEADLEVDLFHRGGRYPRLTDEGEILLQEARQIVGRVHHLSDRAAAFAEGVEPRVRLVVDELISPGLLADVAMRFNERFPETKLDFSQGIMGDISEAVYNDRADLGVEIPVNLPDGRCAWHQIGRLDFLIVVPPGHPLATLESVSREDLEAHLQLAPLIRMGDSGQSVVLGKNVWQFENTLVAREVLLRGVGWSAMPEYLVQHDLAEGRLVKLPLDFTDRVWSSRIFLVHQQGKHPGPAARWLSEAFALELRTMVDE